MSFFKKEGRSLTIKKANEKTVATNASASRRGGGGLQITPEKTTFFLLQKG
jgi:hypothetical protein